LRRIAGGKLSKSRQSTGISLLRTFLTCELSGLAKQEKLGYPAVSTSSKSPGQIESLFMFLFVAVVVSDVSVPLDEPPRDEPPRDEPRAFAGGNGEVGIAKDMSTFIGCVEVEVEVEWSYDTGYGRGSEGRCRGVCVLDKSCTCR
jgi:hypothetical protein